jgi:UDP-2,3-diacylglucosamine hydrolase
MLPMNQVKRNSVYFLADFHLGVPNKKASLEREKKIVRFLESIKDDAKQIYLLGDIFDLWFEYKYVVPKGYVRLLGKLAELTDNGVKIDFFCGNHDFWQKDYFEKELNIKIHKESSKIIVLDGKRFMIGHGDGLDKSDFKYKFIDFMFKNWASIKFISLCPTNWFMSVGNSWSKKSRKSHKAIDLIDLKEKEPIYVYCKKVLEKEDIDYFVFGHRHIVCDITLNNKARYINVGDWVNDCCYAKWNNEELIVKRFEKE